MNRFLLPALALLLAFGAGYATRAYTASLAAERDRATLAAHEATIDALRRQGARLDTIYQRDTLTLTRWRQRWDTVKSRVTDTLIHRDTVVRLVAVADSTIEACTAALTTCEAQKANLRQRIDADSVALRALSRDLARAKVRNRFGCALGPSVSPRGLDYVGVSCGVRIW